jgi:hypothetical protein
MSADEYAATLPGLGRDLLSRPVAGMVLHCGGDPKRARFAVVRGPCREKTIVPFTALTDEQTLYRWLTSGGWMMALGSTGAGASEVVDGQLTVPGVPVVEPLCPACGRALMDRLSKESKR